MNNLYSNEDYLLYRKNPRYVKIYLFTLLILIAIFAFVGNIKYKKYMKYHALYYDNCFYFETDVIYDLKEMYINGKKYPYNVLSIDNNGSNYIVKISSSLSSEWFLDDNYIDIYFVYQETSVFKEVFKKYGKGD